MTDTKERPTFKSSERSKRFTFSEYQEDARDRARDHERDAWRLLAHYIFQAPKREAISQLEKHVRSIAEASAQKPRWQKIIEHANSLADELGMSREEFYSRALIDLIEKLENERLTEEYDEAYREMGEEEDLTVLNHLVRHYDPRLADE
jgi:hypothetical protein